MELPIWQRWFCSVGSPCIAEAIHWSQPSHKVEKLLFWKSGVSTFFLCKVILKTSSVTKRLQRLCCQPTIYRLFVDILPRYDLFWWLVPEKIAFCLQRSGTKYRYFIWAKRSTARRAVMVHSAHSIARLLASFHVALPSEREKPSWIDWTIEISPCMRWFLLGRFPARRSHFRVSHHVTYCARRSLTSYWPVVHTCSHFGARIRRRAMPRWTVWKLSAALSVDPDDWLTFVKHLVKRKSQFPCGIFFLCLAQRQVQIWGRHFLLIVGFRSPNFA